MDSNEPFGPNFAKAVALQMEADREHMEVLKQAVESLFPVQQQHSIDMSEEAKRGNAKDENILKLKAACKTHA